MASLADQILGTGLINPVSPGIFINSPAPGTLDSTALENLNSEIASNIPSITIHPLGSGQASGGSSGNSWLDSLGSSLTTSGSGLFGQSGTGSNSLGLSSDSFWTDIFLRAVIIILGFIFTAIGLSMFGNKAAQVVINETRRSFHA